MNDLPGDPTLPPGCSSRDLELAAGAVRICRQCGRDFEPRSDGIDSDLCPRCNLPEDDWREDR